MTDELATRLTPDELTILMDNVVYRVNIIYGTNVVMATALWRDTLKLAAYSLEMPEVATLGKDKNYSEWCDMACCYCANSARENLMRMEMYRRLEEGGPKVAH